MNKEDLTAKDFLQHVLEAADRVFQYTVGEDERSIYGIRPSSVGS